MIKIICCLILFLFLPIVLADSTFFDNTDDSFIMGSSEQDGGGSNGGSSNGGNSGGDGFKKEPLNETTDPDEKNDIKKDNVTYDKTKDYSPEEISTNQNYILFFVIITLFCGVCFGIFKYRKKINHLINGLSREYNDDSIKGLIDKKVYTDEGYYVGKIEEVILSHSKIYGLKVRLDQRHKFMAKGVIIRYENIKSIGKIVIANDMILSHLRKYKN